MDGPWNGDRQYKLVMVQWKKSTAGFSDIFEHRRPFKCKCGGADLSSNTAQNLRDDASGRRAFIRSYSIATKQIILKNYLAHPSGGSPKACNLTVNYCSGICCSLPSENSNLIFPVEKFLLLLTLDASLTRWQSSGEAGLQVLLQAITTVLKARQMKVASGFRFRKGHTFWRS